MKDARINLQKALLELKKKQPPLRLKEKKENKKKNKKKTSSKSRPVN